jgi:hypothetical protein
MWSTLVYLDLSPPLSVDVSCARFDEVAESSPKLNSRVQKCLQLFACWRKLLSSLVVRLQNCRSKIKCSLTKMLHFTVVVLSTLLPVTAGYGIFFFPGAVISR